MKTRLILFTGSVILLMSLAVLYRQRRNVKPAPGKPCGDIAQRLTERVATMPHPAMTGQPALAAASVTAAAPAAASAASAKVLDEAVLAPLRRGFTPPRFTPDPDVPRERQTLLSNRLLATAATRSLPAKASGSQSPTGRGTTPFIVQFNVPVSAATRQMLTEQGAYVRGFLPNNSILAELTPAVLKALAGVPAVHAVEEYLPSDKLQPFLSYLAAAQPPAARVRLLIQTFAPEDAATVARAVATAGGTTEKATAAKDRGLVRAVVPLSAVESLAALGEVQWIEERPPPQPRNDQAAIPSHLNVTNVWHTRGLTGRGQVVGHADTGLDTGAAETLHEDLRGRVRAIIARSPTRPDDASDIHGHGTHTAGSILGNGANSVGNFRGMAWEAELVHQSVMGSDTNSLDGIPDDLGELFGECYALGARLHSDSWGADTYGAYDIYCGTADMFAWENQDHLAVISAGNSGRDSNSSGVVNLGSVGSPAAAKNVVTVGATENDRPYGSGGYSASKWSVFVDRYTLLPYFPANPIRSDLISYSATVSPYRQGIAAFSSRGPTQDGRVKPDVVAPGTDVISTKSSVGTSGLWGYVTNNEFYRFCGGTSMSAPLAAGAAALLRQYAEERAMVTNPSAALVKAMLVGGARTLTPGQYGTGAYREIPAESPNNVEGWGQPDIEATLFPANGGVVLLDRIQPGAGQTNTFAVKVVRAGQPLDVALVWIDYPATVGAMVTLVNDLDLLLEGPGGTAHANGGTGPDRVNTVETVRLAAAEAGVYHIKVIGAAVPYEGGAAALYLRGALAPVLSHTPPDAQVYGAAVDTGLEIQPPGVIGTGDASMFWAAGDDAGPTGVWHETQAVAVSNALYSAEIPPQPPGVTVHYYYQVKVDGADPVLLPSGAPAELFSVYIGVEVDLTVDGNPAQYSAVLPPYGTASVIATAPFTVAAPAVVPVSDGVRQACVGWEGSGDIISQTGAAAGTLAISNASALTWMWQTHYSLTNRYRLADTGEIFGTSVSWHDAGAAAQTETALELGFVGAVPYAFCGWSVDGARWPAPDGASPNPASGILMDRPRLAQGDYLPFWQDSDGNGLSDWWELRYTGQAAGGLDGGDDLDGDLWSNAAEFLDNTDPNDSSSAPVPPQIAVSALDPFQNVRPPWTVQAQITDNFNVEAAWLVWREKGDTVWRTNSMSFAGGNLWQAALDPPALGNTGIYYFVAAIDLLGYYLPSFRAESPVYSVIGDYDAPWLAVAPEHGLGMHELGGVGTNLMFTVANLAGPDLVWTARVAEAAAAFAAADPGWSHSGVNDKWCVTYNRTWNGEQVWYCGDPDTRLYPDDCHAKLDTPPFRVGPGGGLLWRQWIRCEADYGPYYWDGAVVLVSSDGGVTFELATPYGGYPFMITPNPASPFPFEHPCLAGGGEGWQTMMLDLADFEGQDVIVRFEFGSDSYVADEGWYVAGVTPFSFGEQTPPWFGCQGAWQGVLPDTWSAQVAFDILPEHITPHAEVAAVIRVESNDPAQTPLLPVTARRGYRLNLTAEGPGSAAADRLFLFRTDEATVTLQADSGCYLYGVTVNGMPRPGEYGYGTASIAFTLENIAEDLQITAWFAPRLWNLTVISDYSTADPAAGTHVFAENTVIEASVVSPLEDMGSGIRQQCGGWTLTGHSPADGASNHLVFTITTNATLTWNWDFAHRLTAAAGPNGTLEPEQGWYFAGTTVVITAYPSAYYHLGAWTGDIVDAGFGSNRLTVVMIQPRTVGATFEPNLTAARGVPEFWLAEHGWTQDFETAAEADQDGDGMATWQEWLADTDPANALSLLEMTGMGWDGGGLTLGWQGGVARTQELQRADHPAGPWATVHTNLPPTARTNELWLPATGASGFYRVRVP